MKEYIKTLRWCLWVAALLPLVYYARYTIPQLMFIINPMLAQALYIIAFLALFGWAGSRAMQADYSLATASFAGPVVLAVSQLIIGGVLRVITFWPGIVSGKLGAGHPAWQTALSLVFSVFMSYLICFPFALGFAALGAHLKRRGTI